MKIRLTAFDFPLSPLFFVLREIKITERVKEKKFVLKKRSGRSYKRH